MENIIKSYYKDKLIKYMVDKNYYIYNDVKLFTMKDVVEAIDTQVDETKLKTPINVIVNAYDHTDIPHKGKITHKRGNSVAIEFDAYGETCTNWFHSGDYTEQNDYTIAVYEEIVKLLNEWEEFAATYDSKAKALHNKLFGKEENQL